MPGRSKGVLIIAAVSCPNCGAPAGYLCRERVSKKVLSPRSVCKARSAKYQAFEAGGLVDPPGSVKDGYRRLNARARAVVG